jgi:hypothetical protein
MAHFLHDLLKTGLALAGNFQNTFGDRMGKKGCFPAEGSREPADTA